MQKRVAVKKEKIGSTRYQFRDEEKRRSALPGRIMSLSSYYLEKRFIAQNQSSATKRIHGLMIGGELIWCQSLHRRNSLLSFAKRGKSHRAGEKKDQGHSDTRRP